MSMKIEYVAVGGYTTKAYVSWLVEGRTARGVHKHGDYPVYVRWQADRELWIEEDPVHIIEEYVMRRMGHCDDCSVTHWKIEGHRDGDAPPRCDCAWRTVAGLFADIAEDEEE